MNVVDQVWPIAGGVIRFVITTADPLTSEVFGQVARVSETVESFAYLCGFEADVSRPGSEAAA